MDFEKLLEEAAGKKLAGKKKQLQSSYDQSLADLAELEQGAAQQAREAATRRTAEAKQDRAAWNEIQTAQGLTSGAQSQALLAMDNQLRGDLTAIANTRDSATAELARKRQALARDLAQQLEQAQLESDYEQIMERYQLRKDQDSQAAQNQKAMAALLAQAGDFSLYGALYGLTPEQIRRLEAHYAAQQESWGDCRRLGRGGHVPGKGGHHGKLGFPQFVNFAAIVNPTRMGSKTSCTAVLYPQGKGEPPGNWGDSGAFPGGRTLCASAAALHDSEKFAP